MKNIQFNSFKKLHSSSQALILLNIWDAASAAIVEKHGASAIATSSASLAWSNGYADGGKLPKSVLINAIKNILRVISVPLSVDIEDGYNDSPEEVAQFVAELVELGVAGINIEDGSSSPKLLIEKIRSIQDTIGKETVFINARTDVYLRGLVSEKFQLNESISRAKKYLNSGANCIFIPGMANPHDIVSFVAATKAPLNIMVSQQQKDLGTLAQAGAKRISLGPNPFITAYNSLIDQNPYVKNQTAESLSYDSLNQFFSP